MTTVLVTDISEYSLMNIFCINLKISEIEKLKFIVISEILGLTTLSDSYNMK